MNILVNSPVYSKIIWPLTNNKMLGLCVATGCGSVFVYWWYTSSLRATLRQTQENCQAMAESAFTQSRQLLKGLEEDWMRDMKTRDESVRRLELQNVEQTRSIARLEAAMKLCIPQRPEVPE